MVFCVRLNELVPDFQEGKPLAAQDALLPDMTVLVKDAIHHRAALEETTMGGETIGSVLLPWCTVSFVGIAAMIAEESLRLGTSRDLSG